MSGGKVTDAFAAAPLPGKNADGYILLEALLAILLLSVGMLALAGVYQRSMAALQLQKYELAPARLLAESLLSQYELRALTGLPVRYTQTGPAIDEVSRAGQNGRFDYRIEFEEWPAVAGLQQLRVTVSWHARGQPGSLTLSAVLPRAAAAP